MSRSIGRRAQDSWSWYSPQACRGCYSARTHHSAKTTGTTGRGLPIRTGVEGTLGSAYIHNQKKLVGTSGEGCGAKLMSIGSIAIAIAAKLSIDPNKGSLSDLTRSYESGLPRTSWP